MRATLLSLLLSGLVPLAGSAQTIRGTVRDDATGAAVVRATVALFAGDTSPIATALTDSTGVFMILARRGGNVTIRVSHASYTTVTSETLALKAGEAIDVELRIGRSAIPLEPLIVTARAQSRLDAFYERQQRAAGFGQFLTRADIEQRSGTVRATDLLRGVPSVEIVSIGRGGSDMDGAPLPGVGNELAPRVQLIALRGSTGPCQPAIYIDGMRFRQLPDGGVDEVLRPEMIEGVEVYTRSAGAPAEFADTGSCGVVAFWSRSHERGFKWSWLKLVGGVGGFALMVMLTR